MKMKRKRDMQAMWILKTLLACYFVTGLLLLLISFMLYRFEWNEQAVSVGIVVTYVISTFAGGFVAGKIKQKKKVVWGLLIGIVYFVLLLFISYGMYRTIEQSAMQLFTTVLLCVCGGALGGMLA